MKQQKVLCVCSGGNSRSVCLAFLLKSFFKIDALSSGVDFNSLETMQMLYGWADAIIVVDKELEDRIPKKFKKKVMVWDVGPDVYFLGYKKELIEKYEEYLGKYLQAEPTK